MVLSHTLAALLLSSSPSAQEGSKSPLPSPFQLKREAAVGGNPLATYAEQLRMEKEYLADETMKGAYWQARGTIEGALGDTLAADKSWNTAFGNIWGSQIVKKSELEGFRGEEAIGVISRAARTHRWVMVGEEHLKPQSRSILPGLLRALRKQGFATLAVETFDSPQSAEATQKMGYATTATGFYTADPVFAEGIREALRLGYKLVAYEAMEQPKEIPPDDVEFRQNFRENLQAKNLKERIYDRDPRAKVLVWGGRAHVLETAQPSGGKSVWTPMAYEFKRLTGVDPLSVYASTYLEQSERRFERPQYKWATDRGLVKRPTIFSDAKGKPFGEMFDMQVFFPRTSIVFGRPDWLARDLGRRPYDIPLPLVRSNGLQLAQAFRDGEPANAVPVDQTLIRPGDPVPSLMLPRGGRFWVRVLDAEAKENGRTTLSTPR